MSQSKPLERELYHYATLNDPTLKGRGECVACGRVNYYQFPMSEARIDRLPCDHCGAPESFKIVQILYVRHRGQTIKSMAADIEVILYKQETDNA